MDTLLGHPFLSGVGLSAYAQGVYYDDHLYEEALKDLGAGEYVVEAWVRGNLFFVDWDVLDESSASNSLGEPSDYSSFNECFETSLLDQIEDWVEDHYIERPKLGPVPPIDNFNSNVARGIVLFMVIAGGGIAVAISPLLALAFIPGIFLYWNFSKAERTTPEEQLARHKRQHQAQVDRWAKSRAAFTESLTSRYRRKLAIEIAEVLGVPERLWGEFATWLLSNSENSRYELESELQRWINQPTFPPAPSAAPEGVSHEEYENYCRLFLHSWGYLDAEVTRFVKDGGIDVESEDLVVQCKHITGNVRAPEVQAIFGIAAQKSKQAVVFSSGGFTKDAIVFANSAEVALFSLRERDGKARALNKAAEEIAGAETSFTDLPSNRTTGQTGGGLMSRLKGALGEGPKSAD